MIGGRVRQFVREWARSPGLPPAQWGLTRDGSGSLRLGEVALRGLLERYGSPLHVVDCARLLSNAARFKAGACEIFYSYKTNPVPGVLRLLHAAGIGAEVVSPYELWLALHLGVEGSAIVYNGPAKSDDSLELAIGRGVMVNLNDRSETPRAAAAARRAGKKARVGIRVIPPGAPAWQFGEAIETGAALAAFEEALKRPELQVVALHAHNNGEIASLEKLDAFAGSLVRFAGVLQSRLGLALEIVDFGGNLPCPSVAHLSAQEHRLAVTLGIPPSPRRPASVPSIERYLERVAAAFGARKRPRIFLEPGRALTGDAQHLLTRVISLRPPDGAGLTFGVLDAGIQVADPLRNESHQWFALETRPGAQRHVYRFTGPSCSTGDVVASAVRLPELLPGDALAVMDCGAYFVPYSTCFSFPRPAVVSVSGSSVAVLRAAERYEDLIALDAEPPALRVAEQR